VHVWLDRPESVRPDWRPPAKSLLRFAKGLLRGRIGKLDTNRRRHRKWRECVEYVEAHPDFDLRTMGRHIGIEQMTILGLNFMVEHYERFIVLEDDCFPSSAAVKTFIEDLDEIEHDDRVFSRYGHHFLCSAENENEAIGRFQGWGWASTRKKLSPFLPEMQQFLDMGYREYVAAAGGMLTEEMVRRLDVTPGRNCVDTIRKTQCWDGFLCLLTAQARLLHKKTSKRVVYNCGGGSDSLHIRTVLREPPFNMLASDEVWDHY